MVNPPNSYVSAGVNAALGTAANACSSRREDLTRYLANCDSREKPGGKSREDAELCAIPQWRSQWQVENLPHLIVAHHAIAAEAADEPAHFQNAERCEDVLHGQARGGDYVVDGDRLVVDCCEHGFFRLVELQLAGMANGRAGFIAG